VDYDLDKVDEMTLALLYLVTTDRQEGYGARAWKGFDWDTMNRLHEKGWISNPKTKALSIAMSEEGFRKSRKLFQRYFGKSPQMDRPTTRLIARSIDEYTTQFPAEVQRVLREMRSLIAASAPGATETISYAIPTFDLNGRHLVHFAAFKHHVGFYPTSSGIAAFKEELKPYKSAKGSVQFPLGQPLPGDLIRRIVEFRVKETTQDDRGIRQ
jgi:uncharacterized protein YdhG (YjbR/CyaY superfamily)